MSPEQARGGSQIRDISAAADVFAMGIILFELLTGRHPFQGETRNETLNKIWEANPQFPNSSIPGDLKAICLKCLKNNPDDRYPDGEALAKDLGRFLSGNPIGARQVGRFERAWKWAGRNRFAAVLLLGLALTIFVGITATSIAAYVAIQRADEADEARDDARKKTELAETKKTNAIAATKEANAAKTQVEIERDQVKASNYQLMVVSAERSFVQRDYKAAAESLDECPVPLRKFEWFVRRANLDGAIGVLDHGTVKRYPQLGDLRPSEINQGGFVTGAAFTADGKEFITCGGTPYRNGVMPVKAGEPLVRFWDAFTGQLKETIPAPSGHQDSTTTVSVSPDGKWVAVHCTMLYNQWSNFEPLVPIGQISIFERATKKISLSVKGNCFAFSPDSTKLALGRGNKIDIIELPLGKQLRALN